MNNTIPNFDFNPFGWQKIPFSSHAEGIEKKALFDVSSQAKPYGFRLPLAITHLLHPLLEPRSSEYDNNLNLLLLATRRSTILARRSDNDPDHTKLIRFRIPQITMLELAFGLSTRSDDKIYTIIGIASELKPHPSNK